MGLTQLHSLRAMTVDSSTFVTMDGPKYNVGSFCLGCLPNGETPGLSARGLALRLLSACVLDFSFAVRSSWRTSSSQTASSGEACNSAV